MAVNTKIQSAKDVEADLAVVLSLWGGTRAMREAGKEYLPQEPGEEKADYDNRKARTTLTNIFKKTINVNAGRVFEDAVTIEGQPDLEEFIENVDLEGRDFHRFSYDLSRLTLRDGLRFIMVDAPKAVDENGDPLTTLAAEQAAGIRPYFVEIDRRAYLGCKTKVVAGQHVIIQFRMMEQGVVSEDDFTTTTVDQIRVIEPKLIRLYRQDTDKVWTLHQTIPTSIDFVPIVPVFSDRQGYLKSTPPMMDIAWLNIEHWQKSSDQSNILHVARVPILHWAGYKPTHDAEGKQVELTVGPNTMAKSPNEGAKLTYVEHSGAAIDAGRTDLLDIEDRMVALGAEFATPRKPGKMTATEKEINESGDISDLSAFAQNLKDSLTLAMDMVTKLKGTTFTGTIILKTDLGIMGDAVNIPELVKIRANGDISREGLFEVLNKTWDTKLDAETETDRISTEPPAIGGGGGSF